MTSLTISKSKDIITNLLRENVLSVVFIKNDGSERVMECTLKPDLLPVQEQISEPKNTTRAENPDVLKVYDLENNGWRSFRVDSVLSYLVKE